MTDATPSATTQHGDETIEQVRARLKELELRLQESTQAQQERLIRAELKAEAVRAGMVDLDGLKLADLSAVKLDENGEVQGARALMRELRARKPWLFAASTSSAASPPPSAPPQAKRATDMTDEEWRAARAELLRRL